MPGRLSWFSRVSTLGNAAIVLVCALALAGCVCVEKIIRRQEWKIRIQAADPESCIVSVANKTDYVVPADGHVILATPPHRHGGVLLLFGFIKLEDKSPGSAPLIRIQRGDTILKTLSFDKLNKLPVDDEGYHVIKIR